MNQNAELIAALQRLLLQCDRLRLEGQRETSAEQDARALLARIGGAQ